MATSADKKTYVGYSQSASGVLFYITDKNSKPSILNETLPAECSFISEGIGSTTSPVTYVDPTPTITKITFQCLSNTSGRLPLGGNLTGTATWTDSNNVTTTENYTKATFSSMKTLTAGITYTLAFDGTYDNFGVDSTSGYPLLVHNCLTSVDHFGEQTGVKSFRSAFTNNTRNFSVPENIPSTVTDLSRAFYGAQNFNAANVSKWNTSNVTNFDSVFYQAYNFNQPLNSWDMSKAKNLNSMFMFASKFNQPLDKWNVSGATSMSSMFNRAVAFDQPLNSWDVSNVTSMSYMFNDAKYNQPLDRWDVSKVQSMEGMFQGVNNMTQFNQDISGWRVSSVTDFDSMFFGNAIFYQDLSKWPAKSTASRTDFSRGSKLATNTAYLPKFNGV